ncbi:UNVERIFIED_CONTAM: hypothetical protein Sindi_1031600, partial [Sesamum indicum]
NALKSRPPQSAGAFAPFPPPGRRLFLRRLAADDHLRQLFLRRVAADHLRRRRLFLGGAELLQDFTALLSGQRRGGYQEVNGAPFELGFRGQDQNPAGHALGAWLCENVIRVVLEDLAGGDPTRYFFYAPV